MGSVKIEITDTDPKFYHGRRINQGEVCAAREPMGTLLRSCVCVGFHHAASGAGAISHITGFGDHGCHGPQGALTEMRRRLREMGIALGDCECFVVGGSDRAIHVYNAAIQELKRWELKYRELDILGCFHRKLIFDPATGQLVVYKKSEQDMATQARKTYSSDTSYSCFHDTRRRLITGASLFFRNEPLIRLMRETILPTLSSETSRLHTWCAGCSNGMEVYSIAMIAQEWLTKNGHGRVDFKILGSDISADALATAARGEYALSEQAVKSYAELFHKYSTRLEKNLVRINDDIRRLTAFKERDIRVGSRNHKFEFIVCDHVLQYFEPDVQEEFLAALVKALQPRGFLFASSPSPIVPERLKAWGFLNLARSLYRRKDA